ncbi:tRNA-queuosine alpha-mannosyltransferase domain-containing protein [Aliamphritea ceti]|uniref:tRNA-queuosine alpha-mannosyltransferase domain-containing protein n=1 Tax=Aliamphritea ceti TaxID=1524258 RepID=UPI0021C30144|nr:DUF3524 domain-containing protein [Aliamphritea ceti]
MKILLLSAYDADSHRYWHQNLIEQFPEHDWTLLTLPARYFSWRIRGNSLSWAFGPERSTLEQPYDLLIATSMTDLSALKGMVPNLANTPTMVYFHENQFAYPATEKAHKTVEPQILNIYTAASADRILFNTAYNRDTFLHGASALLKKLPDQVPAELVTRLKNRSEVLPVPLENRLFTSPEQSQLKHTDWQDDDQRALRIVWAARWEYDKGPGHLLAILQQFETQDIDYRLCLLGQKFRHSPNEFNLITEQFKHRLVQFGYAESRDEYLQWLRGADIFLSTAIHEFQGLSVSEAVTCGCLPLLPAREVYPVLFDETYLYSCSDDINQEAKGACEKLTEYSSPLTAPAQPDSSHLSWKNQRENYRQIFTELADQTLKN